MAAKKKQLKKPRRPLTRGVDQTRLARCLAVADISGPSAATRQFGIPERTLMRLRADLREGKRPELAELVRTETQAALEASRDLVDEAMRVHLRRAITLAATVNPEQNMGYIEKLGDLKMARDTLNNGQTINTRTSNGQDRQGQTAASQVPAPEAESSPEPDSNVVLFRNVS